jgi:hypothetical protein
MNTTTTTTNNTIANSQSLVSQLKAMPIHENQIILISTTAKSNHENRLLPSHVIAGKACLNLIINDTKTAKEVMAYLDNYAPYFLIDVERKQTISLWEIAQNTITKGTILPYKPNDITVNAACILINQFFQYNINQKKALIYGSGNIATKLALSLAEHEAHVSLAGRNLKKIGVLKEALNAILPAYSTTPITVHTNITPQECHLPQERHPERSEGSQEVSTNLHFNLQKYDILVCALSSEHSIDEGVINQLHENALVVDIGINNLTPAFIEKAQEKSFQIFRLDVRIGSPFIEASLEAYHRAFLSKQAGKRLINQVPCVAGGAIGARGDLIVDNISSPKQVIAIANGTGGVKKHEEYTEDDNNNLKKIKAIL